MSVKLQQPITGGGLQNTNFFNGRLVTGADMTREQNARREAVSRLGQAVGEGIAEGLRVEIVSNAENNPVVGITAGRAINRCGQVLGLFEETSVNLVERVGTVEQESTVFSRCPQSAVTGTYAAGFGLYLLVLSPISTKQGSAPTGGLKNSFAACSSDVILEAVQLRLLPVDPFLANEALPGRNRLRNYIAYRCFGTPKTQQFYKNPSGFSLESYGLLDEMRDKTLSKNDVPLAIISWTENGLEFVEMWAVRRRVSKINDAKDWTQLLSDRRLSETEAMIQQFADHLAGEEPEKNDFRQIAAVDFFYYLPPVGMLPLATSGSKAGFDLDSFFGARYLDDIAMLDGDSLQPLLREAAAHEPINLRADEKIQIYLVRENFLAAQAGQVKQLTAVFAKRNLPYFGTARFDLADWNLSRFV
jgi:hypothetical protein